MTDEEARAAADRASGGGLANLVDNETSEFNTLVKAHEAELGALEGPALDARIAELRETARQNVRNGTMTSQPGGGGGQQKYPEGATATNPETGEKMVVRGGKWVPVQ
jgi:hypothetical protein